jgi:hypothetical protein
LIGSLYDAVAAQFLTLRPDQLHSIFPPEKQDSPALGWVRLALSKFQGS